MIDPRSRKLFKVVRFRALTRNIMPPRPPRCILAGFCADEILADGVFADRPPHLSRP